VVCPYETLKKKYDVSIILGDIAMGKSSQVIVVTFCSQSYVRQRGSHHVIIIIVILFIYITIK
jgi:hypothetical protein